jgi:hypothetical protein
VAGEDEVDPAPAQEREDVARVEHLVSLAAGSRDWHQVVVADEDAQVGLTGEALLDPAVVLAPDLAFVEVGLGGIDGDECDLEPLEEARARVAGAEGVLEVQVPDIAGVVVARHADDQRARQRGELLLGERILVGVALVGQVASDDDEVGLGRVDLLDRGAEKPLAKAAAADVDVGELRDQHRHSLTRPRWLRPAAGIVSSSATLTLGEAADEERFNRRLGDGDTGADEVCRVPQGRTDRDG